MHLSHLWSRLYMALVARSLQQNYSNPNYSSPQYLPTSELINQALLPPETTCIRRGVHNLRDASRIDVLDLAIVSVQGEMR